MTILSTRVERSRNQVERDSAVYVICGDREWRRDGYVVWCKRKRDCALHTVGSMILKL